MLFTQELRWLYKLAERSLMEGFNFSLHYPFNKTHRFVSVLENRDNIYFKMFYLKVLVVCEKEIPLLQVSKHEDDSDTTLSLPCVFLAIPFPSRWVSVCLCVCRLCIGHLAELCCHFWFWAAALSSNPEYWQGEQSVLTQRKPAFACDSLYPLSYPENGSQCKPGQCRGD